MNDRYKGRLLLLLFVILIIVIVVFSVVKTLHSKDRCQEYIPDIRQYSLQYLGPTFPYWYNVGCAMTETSCRGNLVSFDGGIGLFQLTPSTGITKEISKYIPVDPYDTKSNIRAQSYYLYLVKEVKFKSKSIIFKNHKISPKDYVDYCGFNLSDVYRFYNSGYWFFYESTLKPNTKFVCSNDEMKKFCVRGGTYTDKNKTNYISFCDVSYSYPVKVSNFSKIYSNNQPDQINFWYKLSNNPSYSSNVVVPKKSNEYDKNTDKLVPKENLKPYPGALPPPETLNLYKKIENDKGDETFSLYNMLNDVNLFSM